MQISVFPIQFKKLNSNFVFEGCDSTDLVLVPNATTAINCVIRGIKFQKADTIFFLSTTYGKSSFNSGTWY